MTRLFAPLFASILAALLLATPAVALCAGRNLLADMPPATRALLDAAADAVPYPRGIFWRATRGGQVITLIGTYHFNDPRHAATLRSVAPLIAAATTVLVEAGPDEQKALAARLARDPALMLITQGPTLIDLLPPADWQALRTALAARGVPGMIAAKFQPWYVNVLLAIPACALTPAPSAPGESVSGQSASGQSAPGLDAMIIDAALAAKTPIRALEPYDTLLSLFDLMTPAEHLAMIKSALALDRRAEDFTATLTEAYFAGETRLIWEFMRLQSYGLPGYGKAMVDAEFARMEQALMVNRNRNWLPVLTGAAADGPVVAAFGALHLSGKEGVLALLERDGFALERLEF